MTALRTKGGASAPSNIVRLPTAARRKVEQRWNRQTRAVAFPMREQWPGQYVPPHVRRQMADAQVLLSFNQTPALALASAIFDALDARQKDFVRALLANREGEASKAAHVLVKERCIGDACSLGAALELLRGEG